MKDSTRERVEQIGLRAGRYDPAKLVRDYAVSLIVNPGMSLDERIQRFACMAAICAREIDEAPDMRRKILEHCRTAEQENQ